MDALTYLAAELCRDELGATFADPTEQVDFDELLMVRKRNERAARDLRRRQEAQHDPRPVRRCALYRHYDAAGVLLYIGISEELSSRTQEHARSAVWARFVADSRASWYPNRWWAEEDEAEAIRDERPLFNATHNDAVTSADRVRYLVAQHAWDLLDPRARRGA